MERIRNVVVVGGGAAGLFCAAEAARRGRSVLVLERGNRLGAKIAISGGGRCNFTNLHTAPESFLSENLDFCRSALARFTPADIIAKIEARGIAYHEKTLGQLFCDGSARQVVEMLRADCEAAGVEIRTGVDITAIERPDQFRIATAGGEIRSDALVLASGGLSIPKLGATDLAYRVAERFGLRVVPPRPALVPLVLATPLGAELRELSGVSFQAIVRCGGAEFAESVLVTHRGLSGPAILQASSYWRPGTPVVIDLLPDHPEEALLEAHRGSAAELATVLSSVLPKRFAQAWCALESPSRPLRQIDPKARTKVAEKLHAWTIVPTGTEGYAKAEVTAGGIDTRDLSSKTMEARSVPGLFCIGEAVDVTGHLGGFNFQWAWASAHAAGKAA